MLNEASIKSVEQAPKRKKSFYNGKVVEIEGRKYRLQLIEE